jgi:hypothetical protein
MLRPHSWPRGRALALRPFGDFKWRHCLRGFIGADLGCGSAFWPIRLHSPPRGEAWTRTRISIVATSNWRKGWDSDPLTPFKGLEFSKFARRSNFGALPLYYLAESGGTDPLSFRTQLISTERQHLAGSLSIRKTEELNPIPVLGGHTAFETVPARLSG